jgi:hypothetical protein
LLLRVPDDSVYVTLVSIRDNDPDVKKGMAQNELLPWAPSTGLEKLNRL